MRRLASGAIGCGLVWAGVAQAQFGRGSGWATTGNDAQRSYWLRADPKISRDSMAKPGFAFVWKLKLAADAKHSSPMAPPALLEGYIGYRGFRSLGYVSVGADNLVAMDTDLGRVEWQKRLPAAPAQSGACAGLTASMTRPITTA